MLAVGRRWPGKDFGSRVQAWAEARAHIPDLEFDIIGAQGLVEPTPPGFQLWPTCAWREAMHAMRAADLVARADLVVGAGGNVQTLRPVHDRRIR